MRLLGYRPAPPALPDWERGPRRLTVVGHVDTVTSYGQLTCGIIRDLLARGIDVAVVPLATWEPWETSLPPEVRRRLVHADPDGAGVLQLSPPLWECYRPGRTAWVTMWESGELPAGAVARLNQAAVLCLPCRWNEDVCRAGGVTVPLRYAPLGLLPDYTCQPPPDPARCVVGVAGRLAHGGIRKGVAAAVEAFCAAFPAEADVECRVHLHPDCRYDAPADPRVTVTRGAWGPVQMRDWYAGLTVYLTLATAEGFGMLPLEAMGCGRPVIGVQAHGHAEFLDATAGYPLAWRSERAETTPDPWQYRGPWFRPSVASAVRALREVYADRDRAAALGQAAAVRAQAFPRARFHQAIWEALESTGAV